MVLRRRLVVIGWRVGGGRRRVVGDAPNFNCFRTGSDARFDGK